MDSLEYSDMSAEVEGCMIPGKLKLTNHHIIFKYRETREPSQIQASDIDTAHFQNFSGTWGIRIFLKDGLLHRFVGFKETDKEKLAKFCSSKYKLTVLEKELSLKGCNWGTAQFSGSVLSFNSDETIFEIPLNYVSQCTGGKNEIAMEFHQNDDAPVSLMEMRLFIPPNEVSSENLVENFQKQVIDKASVINLSGDAIATFREIQCLTPRGRYDIKIFQTLFQLHGKTFDYKIPVSTVLKLFILPHKDGRQMFFVISLDPPIKQGQTRYHFLVLLFGSEEESTVDLPFSHEELKEKFSCRLEQHLSGPTYEVLGTIMKAIVNKKPTGPGTFIGHSGTPAIGCSLKAAAGYLYPLENGFLYVHKPPLHIKFEEVENVNFARGEGSTRSFDVEIGLKSGSIHTFNSIEKEEYAKLYDFVIAKKLHIKNREKNGKSPHNKSFEENDKRAPDAYLERVKAEAQERDEDDSSSAESIDEDFKPPEESEATEYDSQSQTSTGDDSSSDGELKMVKKRKQVMKTNKSEKASKQEKVSRTKKSKSKEKDANKPKRPPTAFMLWLNATRDEIKQKHSGIKVTEVAKIGGEMWKNLADKAVWEAKAAKAKEEYQEAIKKTQASVSEDRKKPATKKSSDPVLEFKSKEFISDDDSSSEEQD